MGGEKWMGASDQTSVDTFTARVVFA